MLQHLVNSGLLKGSLLSKTCPQPHSRKSRRPNNDVITEIGEFHGRRGGCPVHAFPALPTLPQSSQVPPLVMPGPAYAKPKRLRFGEGRPAEGRVPGIHAVQRACCATWMRGTSPRKTTRGCRRLALSQSPQRERDSRLGAAAMLVAAISALVGARQPQHVLGQIGQDQIGRDRRHLIEPRFAEFALDVVFLGEAEAAMGLNAHIARGP
jgi:hypothetical protein